MKNFWQKLVPSLFNILFFFTPLILFPKTTELFEFNKIVFIYLITVLIIASWLTRMVLVRKILFRRTILDLPLLFFLASQFLSFLVSIDRHTSIFGYYGRFNGGLLSSVIYSLLYWAFVSNMDTHNTRKSLYHLLTSAFLVAIYGVLQHFGIDKELWVQDVQSRVFSTLGQPNWLATFFVALIPLTWALALHGKRRAFWGLSIIFFITLTFTKSRSGFLGFVTAYTLFWGLYFFKDGIKIRAKLKTFALIASTLLLVAILIGSPWTPSLEKVLSKNLPVQEEILSTDPGGTESGEIRKIVWKGAIDVWKNYPLLGSGVETFAYSFYQFRPKEHNLVSEWDFLYNKAHNEYLNYAATTGAVGLFAYFTLIVFSVLTFVQIPNSKFQIPNNLQNSKSQNNYTLSTMHSALLSGYAGILVANFFGFSTTTTSLLFFLYPAIAIALGQEGKKVKEQEVSNISLMKRAGLSVLFLFTLLLLYLIARYWYSDFLFAKGRGLGEDNFYESKKVLMQAISLSPGEPLYQNELASVLSFEALSLEAVSKSIGVERLAKEAVTRSQKAVELSPRNLLLLRNSASILVRLSTLDPTYMQEAKNTMLLEAKYSPTDAKLFYNLGLAYERIGQTSDAINALEKTVFLKENYRDARFALALLYVNEGRPQDAERELQYILEKINPDDALAQQEYHELTGK